MHIYTIYVCEVEKFPESCSKLQGNVQLQHNCQQKIFLGSSALVSCMQEIAALNSGVGTGRMASAAYGTGGLYTAVKTIQIRTGLNTLQTQSRGHARMEGDMFRDWREKYVFFKL